MIYYAQSNFEMIKMIEGHLNRFGISFKRKFEFSSNCNWMLNCMEEIYVNECDNFRYIK